MTDREQSFVTHLSIFFQCTAIFLASNYFAFQIELFDEEYEANHPSPTSTVSFRPSSLNWESFDKENAPKAFVFDAGLRVHLLFTFCMPHSRLPLPFPPYQPIRDKSPPQDSGLNF